MIQIRKLVRNIRVNRKKMTEEVLQYRFQELTIKSGTEPYGNISEPYLTYDNWSEWQDVETEIEK